jgi:NTE family protein
MDPSLPPAAGLLRRLRRRRRLPVVSLALQGGGAHGAFTWGVLDRLLEEEGFAVEAASGTSAGALNAATMASGWAAGGREGARAALTELWRAVAELGRSASLRAAGLPRLALDLAAHLLSPSQLNPLGIDPLRGVLERLIDPRRLQEGPIRLFVAATAVRTGAVRIFTGAELSIEALLASACLPQVHRAVEVGGDAYWDGGYVSNPPLLPLVEACRAPDLLLVRINPDRRDALPTGAGEIRNRIGELVFGTPLARELALLAERVARARRSPLARLRRTGRRYARHRLHVIDGGPHLAGLDPMTKVLPDRTLVLELRTAGRAAAEAWLAGRTGGQEVARTPAPPASQAAA